MATKCTWAADNQVGRDDAQQMLSVALVTGDAGDIIARLHSMVKGGEWSGEACGFATAIGLAAIGLEVR